MINLASTCLRVKKCSINKIMKNGVCSIMLETLVWNLLTPSRIPASTLQLQVQVT